MGTATTTREYIPPHLRYRSAIPTPKQESADKSKVPEDTLTGDGGVSYNSNSNGDPNYDIRKLVDWKGDWLPAPVEWDGRKCFTDRHFSDHLELWMNGTDEKTCTNEINISGPGFVDEKNGELAPRYWMPIRIEGEAPRHFWRSFVGRTPAPLSDIDIDEVPWWETYADNTTNLLPHRPVPDAQVDPEEEENQHPGVFVTSKEAIQCKERARIEKERKQLEKRRRREAEIYAIQMTPLPPIPNLTLKPTANIYLRPVVPVDIQQVTDIYNHYVRETIYANEFKGRTHTQIADRIDDIKSRGIPWIVAIDRSEQPKKGRLQLYVSEKVVGFANVDDYCDAGSMYRYTFEMEMFVHHEYLHKGVGKCLLDRMQALVDPGYSARGGYDWIVKTDYLKNGSTRVVKTINCSFPHELGKSTDLDRVTTWLKQFGWRKSGHLYQMGFKHGKAVDVSIFQYVTMEHIEANTIPTQPL
ncbi:hypothetical protein K469DRAFT_727935 [Zopfia rhizophila CBS 207.26]|uniref:N-acetyltransferase domain-containing protein n=1 Tax=Zopfia rhizophila CBS 207.26 TaxID=1314779 RepID=A0A6A6DXC4_9PEZI|nr:hypothetical protein K469DRAFT_727935 [Zopfia rhizophila CBS 207.26]